MVTSSRPHGRWLISPESPAWPSSTASSSVSVAPLRLLPSSLHLTAPPTIQDGNRHRSWVLYCWYCGIKNSRFDEPAISIYRRFEAPCSKASPWGEAVSFADWRGFISSEFQFLSPRNVACQTGSNLANQLHHRTWKRTHDKTLNWNKNPSALTGTFISAVRFGRRLALPCSQYLADRKGPSQGRQNSSPSNSYMCISSVWSAVQHCLPFHSQGRQRYSVRQTDPRPSGFDERPTTNELRLFPPLFPIKKRGISPVFVVWSPLVQFLWSLFLVHFMWSS